MTTLLVLGAWFAVATTLCLLLGAVVRRGDEALDAPPPPPRPGGPRATRTAPLATVLPTQARAPSTRPVPARTRPKVDSPS